MPPQRLCARHQGAQIRQRATESAQRPSLDENVAERRRLDRPGDHGQTDAVRDRLAEQPVLSSAPDHVNFLMTATREPGCLLQRRSESCGQTLNDATNHRGLPRWRRKTAFLAP
jgi:hypothetical protein